MKGQRDSHDEEGKTRDPWAGPKRRQEVLDMMRFTSITLCAALPVALVAPVLADAAGNAGKSDKPRIAVLELKNKADNQWWYHGGAAAAQDVFVTELVKSGKFR